MKLVDDSPSFGSPCYDRFFQKLYSKLMKCHFQENTYISISNRWNKKLALDFWYDLLVYLEFGILSGFGEVQGLREVGRKSQGRALRQTRFVTLPQKTNGWNRSMQSILEDDVSFSTKNHIHFVKYHFFVFKKSQGKQCNFGLQTLPRVTIRISVFKAVGGIHMQIHLMYPFRCKDWRFRLPAEDDWEDSPLKLVWGSRVHCWVLHVETLSTQTLPFVGFQFCRLRKPCQEFVF